MIMPTPFLPKGTINQEGINCPDSEKFRLIFARVLPPQDPQRCPQSLCPDKLTLPTGPSSSQHPCQILNEGSLSAQGITKKFLFK